MFKRDLRDRESVVVAINVPQQAVIWAKEAMRVLLEVVRDVNRNCESANRG